MDPNATLNKIRSLIADHLDPKEAEDMHPDEIARLFELVQALDHWLSRGGFLPHAWAYGRTTGYRPPNKP